MNEKIEVPTMKVPPLKKVCMTIGQLPSSYVETMSYYEMLVWFVNYLRDDIIPVVNANGEATHELQELYVELQSYVNNYFDNLDVQEEINNKLDDMVEQGTLQEIIADYLNSKAVFGFDNVASMKNATNLINGSYARTLGYYSVNDGGSALYKIRTITNDDVVDEKFIIELYDDSLIAELIIQNGIVNVKQIGAKGDGTTNDTNFLQSAVDKVKDVYIPKGTYMISTLVLNSGNKIVGESWYSTIIKSIANNVETSIITTIDGAMRVQIIDLAVDGNRDNNSNEIDGIHLYKTTSGNDTHSYIHNVRSYQCSGNGINLSKQLETRVNHCVANNNSKNGILQYGSDSTIEDCTCSSNYENGIKVTAGANRIINDKCYYNGFKPNTTYAERYSGFYITSANNSIIGCHAQENAGHGFEIYGNEVTMSSCCVDNNGLYLDENRQVINLPEGTDPTYDGVHCSNLHRSYIECAGRNLHLTNGGTQRYSLYFDSTCGKNTFVVSSGNQLSGDVYLGTSTETSGCSNGMRMQTKKSVSYRFLTTTSTVGEVTLHSDWPFKMELENGYVHVYGVLSFENQLTNAMGEVGIIKITDEDKYPSENLNIATYAYPSSPYSDPIGLINGRMSTDGSIKIRNRGSDRNIKCVYFEFSYRPIKQNIE